MSTRRRALGAVALASCALGLTLAVPPAAVAAPPPSITATAETPAEFDDDAGGNADMDDPAIWRNDADPDRSLVITTGKEGGLRVYDLDARQVQTLPVAPGPTPDSGTGRFNNVDLIHGMEFPDGPADVAVVSDRGRDRVRAYRIDPENPAAPLTDVTAADAPRIFSPTEAAVEDQDTVYGLGSYTRDGEHFAVVSRRNTTTVKLLQLEVVDGTVIYTDRRTIDLPSTFTLPDGTRWTPCDEPGNTPQVEGIVIDTAADTVFLAQEAIGIWRTGSDLTGTPELIDTTREFGVPGTYDAVTDECTDGPDPGFGGEHLARDVEGLTIFDQGEGAGYLLASSQGDDTFVAYDRETGAFRTGYAITPGTTADGTAIDGSEECDGSMVSSESFGKRFPNGLLVVQDGFNAPDDLGPDGAVRANTNVKFVDWQAVADATGLS